MPASIRPTPSQANAPPPFYFKLVDATDGLTVESGEAGGQPQISISGANYINTNDTLNAISSGTNGSYYIILTVAEVATPGPHLVRYKSANTVEFEDILYVNDPSELRAVQQRVNYLGQLIQTEETQVAQAQEITEE